MADLVFDKYRILRRLAVGGMGEIYLAQQTGVSGFQRFAILKRLLPQLAAKDHLVEQFLDEARLAANLNHPNIVSIYEVGRSAGTFYIAMEYVHGIDLSLVCDRLEDSGEAMPPAVAARIVHDAAIGLHHAHTAVDGSGQPLHLVHRDVSPANIMVRKDGVTKLVDFGIAKARHRLAKTATGLVKGKLSYFSPEQAEGRTLDARSDQFSLGVVLWELCTGRRLFAGATPADVLRMVTRGKVIAPAVVAAGTPPLLDALAMRMLARQPEDRFPDCKEVASTLGDFLLGQSAPTDTSEVAAFIERVAGDEIDARMTEEAAGPDFVIDLGGPRHSPLPGDNEPPTVAIGPEPDTVIDAPARRSSRLPRAWVLGLALIAGAGLAAGVALTGNDEGPSAASVEPPTVVAAADAVGADERHRAPDDAAADGPRPAT